MPHLVTGGSPGADAGREAPVVDWFRTAPDNDLFARTVPTLTSRWFSVHDPESREPSVPDEPLPVGGAGQPHDDVSYEVAREIVGTVIAWYSRQMLLARRTGDQRRLEELKAERQQCVDDQHRLEEAGPEEITRIADVYTARWKELEAGTQPGA